VHHYDTRTRAVRINPRNLVIFADSFAIPASSVLAYRKYAPRARHRPRSLSAKITRFLDLDLE
jgi:hypothetical protein